MNQYTFNDLLEIMKKLRAENGCPWDREQTNESIKNDTLEEAYEVVEAINNQDDENLAEELGDLLLHVVFHSRIKEEEGRFTVEDVIQGIVEKLIRRHPHVFPPQGNEKNNVNASEEVLIQWEEIKQKEKNYKEHSQGLRNVPKALPALTRAYKVQKKAARCGFDFVNEEQLVDKLQEELTEVKNALLEDDFVNLDEEIGDLLFQTVNIARFFKINPENALTNATEKFINRFEGIEQLAVANGKRLDDLSLKQMDELWEQVKRSK